MCAIALYLGMSTCCAYVSDDAGGMNEKKTNTIKNIYVYAI